MENINNEEKLDTMDFRFKVLFLANENSDKIKRPNGRFIGRRAEAVVQFSDAILLDISPDPNLKNKAYSIDYNESSDIPSVKVRYKVNGLKIPLLPKISDFFRYLKGGYLGLNFAKEKFGRPDIIHADRAFPSGVLALLVNKAENLTYIVEGRDYAEKIEGLSVFSKFVAKLAFKNAASIIIGSESLKNDFKKIGIEENIFFTVSENDPEAGKKIYERYKFIPVKWRVGMSEWVEMDPAWKVLDIGSGHCPARRANVLLEKELDESVHRSGAKAAAPIDKRLVVGDATAMPFKDKEFDYALASHIAEHIEDVDKFISETERVAKRGYIECPGPLSNLVLTEPFHLWSVSISGDTLVFKKLERKEPFLPFIYAFFYLNESRVGRKTFHSKNPLVKFLRFALIKTWKYIPYAYTKYRWKGKIKYKISR